MLTCLRQLKANPANCFSVKSNSSTHHKLAFVFLFSFFTLWVQAQETITVNSVTPNTICFSSSATTAVDVDYSVTGTFTGNTFTAQLSDATGSFATPIVIGTITSDASGIINATIPANTPAGTGYLIRVVSSNPPDVISNTVGFTINSLPALFNVTGGGSYCSGGTGVEIGLDGSETGVRYQLQLNGNPVGSMVGGTGSAISFGLHVAAGTFTVVATNATTNCATVMNGSAIVTINPLPTAFSVTGGGSTTCVAGVVVGLNGSQTGVNYQLRKDGVNIGPPLAGTGSAISFDNRHQSGTYTVFATNATTGCTNTMSGSATVTTPNVTLTVVNKSNCGSPLDDGSITITVASGGPYQFSFNGGAFGSSNTLTNPPLGLNTIQVQDVNNPGCIGTFDATVKTLLPVSASLFFRNAAGCNGTGATIKIDARNGPLPYAFSLDGGATQTSNTFTGVGAGTHSVVVTDARGCTSTVPNINIVQSPPPTATLFRKTGASCNANEFCHKVNKSRNGFRVFRW